MIRLIFGMTPRVDQYPLYFQTIAIHPSFFLSISFQKRNHYYGGLTGDFGRNKSERFNCVVLEKVLLDVALAIETASFFVFSGQKR